MEYQFREGRPSFDRIRIEDTSTELSTNDTFLTQKLTNRRSTCDTSDKRRPLLCKRLSYIRFRVHSFTLSFAFSISLFFFFQLLCQFGRKDFKSRNLSNTRDSIGDFPSDVIYHNVITKQTNVIRSKIVHLFIVSRFYHDRFKNII